MLSDGKPRTWLSRSAFLLLLATLIWIAFFLSDYTNVWVQPEVNAWRGFLPRSYTLDDALRTPFNWLLFEGEPRLTRPLSGFVEMLDNSIRKTLWRMMTPYPTLSVTLLFTLVLTPLFLYGILRALRVRPFVALCGVALYLSNPGVLSLLAMNFRPGKAMVCASIAFILWWASRLSKPTFLYVAPLYVCLFLCLFWDETALIAYPALLLLFPRVVLSSRGSMATFFSIPIGYAMSVRWLLPAVHAALGFPVGTSGTYGPLQKFTGWAMFGSSRGARSEFNHFFPTNARIALMDSLGLINPILPGTLLYYALFTGIVGCLVVLGTLIVRRAVRRQQPEYETTRGAGAVVRSAALLAVSLVFHGVLLSVVGQRTWGLYWYGAFIAIPFAIAAATLLDYLNVGFLAIAFAVLVSAGSFYIFPATNRAYKVFHYYPQRPGLLRSVFENEINRFQIKGPSAGSAEMRRFNRELVRQDASEPVTGAPVELLYLVYELGLKSSGEGCQPDDVTFSLMRAGDAFHLDCEEGTATNEEAREFLGDWLTPSRVTMRPSMFDLMIDGATPIVAHIDGGRIEIPERGLTGQLSSDGATLLWSNGQKWERRSGDSSSVHGGWWFGSKRVIREARPSDILVGNGELVGRIQNGALLVAKKDKAGVLSSDRKRIFWTDSSTWVRP